MYDTIASVNNPLFSSYLFEKFWLHTLITDKKLERLIQQREPLLS